LRAPTIESYICLATSFEGNPTKFTDISRMVLMKNIDWTPRVLVVASVCYRSKLSHDVSLKNWSRYGLVRRFRHKMEMGPLICSSRKILQKFRCNYQDFTCRSTIRETTCGAPPSSHVDYSVFARCAKNSGDADRKSRSYSHSGPLKPIG
jgi:hypothetical protein